MKLFADRSPRELALLTLVGGLMSACGALLMRPFRSHAWIEIALASTCFVGGATFFLKCPSVLRKSIKNSSWPPEQVESLRAVVESPLFTFATFVLLAMFALSYIADRHNQLRSLGWAAFCMSQAASQLQNALRRPIQPNGAASMPRVLAPLQSDHWGER